MTTDLAFALKAFLKGKALCSKKMHSGAINKIIIVF